MTKQTKKVENIVCESLDSGSSFVGDPVEAIKKDIREFQNVWEPNQSRQFVRKNKKVIILGTASTLRITPWDQKDVDYWACAPVMTYKESHGHKIDLLFEMHYMEYWVQIIDRMNEYTVKNPNTFIYMQESVPQIKNSLRYPIFSLSVAYRV